MPYPYIIHYNKTSVPEKLEATKYSRSFLHYRMVATNSGQHPDYFLHVYETKFLSVPSLSTRASAAVGNINTTGTFLTIGSSKKPYLTSKRNIQLLEELVDLLTSHQGTVLDFHAGALTIAVAEFFKFRKCVMVEKVLNALIPQLLSSSELRVQGLLSVRVRKVAAKFVAAVHITHSNDA